MRRLFIYRSPAMIIFVLGVTRGKKIAATFVTAISLVIRLHSHDLMEDISYVYFIVTFGVTRCKGILREMVGSLYLPFNLMPYEAYI